MKYAATDSKGKLIIFVFADNEEEAKRCITILLRGRPGRINYLNRWIEDGKNLKLS